LKLGTVIGRVTLSKSVDVLKGGRFLVVSPFSREQYAKGIDAKPGMGTDPSLVVYDDIGGGVNDMIGYEEGAEAAQPFEVSAAD
jgi:carbon dioxide concentrating mechanism protein CcmL